MTGSVDRRDFAALAVLGLIGIGVPLWLAAAAGAIGLPTIDDFVYTRAALGLFQTGSLAIQGHTASTLGQLALAQPFLWLSGGSSWGFAAFGLTMTLIGLASTYLLARRFVGLGAASMVVLIVEAMPGFARLAPTFMTDVPAFSLTVLCLLLGTVSLQGSRSRLTLAGSIGVGLVAASIREFSIAAPAAVLLVAWARSQAQDRLWLAGLSLALVAGGVGLLSVVGSVGAHGLPEAPVGIGLILLGSTFSTLAAILLPAIVLGIGGRLANFKPGHLVLGAGFVSLVLVMPFPSLLGHLWQTNGATGEALLAGVRSPVIGVPAWGLSLQLAAFAAILLAALGFRWCQHNLDGLNALSTMIAIPLRIARRSDGIPVVFVLAYGFELVAFAFVGRNFDRYLIPIIPVAAILLLQGTGRTQSIGRSQALSHAAFAWLAVSAFVIAANSFAYDVARYHEGEAAVAMGYDARTVDAGYEWVGAHAAEVPQAAPGPAGRTWYASLMSPFPVCAVLSNSPLVEPTLRLIRINNAAYTNYLFFGPEESFYLYGTVEEGCPPPPATIGLSDAP